MWRQIPALPNGIEGFMDSLSDGTYNVAWSLSLSKTLGDVVHLAIFRIDAKPIRDWDTLQQIKNELVGKDVWAYEVYPAEDCLVSTANARHLWCLMRGPLPFGYRFRATDSNEPKLRQKQPVVW